MKRQSELLEILSESPVIQEILDTVPLLSLPNWYLGAGLITQTVWNRMHGYELAHGIKDADLIYFDSDTSYEKEDEFIRKGNELFRDLSIPVEIRNEARVHLWYKKHFGYDIDPYTSSESAIDTWPTIATAIGVRKESNGKLLLYAPFGIDDLLNMVVRPNKRQVTEEIYLKKVNRWKEVWPDIHVLPWEE